MISVIIPVYKVEQYLDRCLESVVGQTYSDIEIILVDDGSPDNCPTMCDAWAVKDSRIKVLHKENGGVSAARNSGIDASIGDFLFFVDSDDYIHPKTLEFLLKCQQQFESDYVIAGHVYSIKEKEWCSASQQYKDLSANNINIKDFFQLTTEKGYITGHLMKRDLVGDFRFPENIALNEDVIFNNELLSYSGIRLSLLDTALYCICYRAGSASAQKRGYEGYYYAAEWCNTNLGIYDDEMKGYIVKEALKKCFLYRYVLKKEGEHYHDNKSVMKELSRQLLRDPRISLKEKIVYKTMTMIPPSYDLYVKILHWNNR